MGRPDVHRDGLVREVAIRGRRQWAADLRCQRAWDASDDARRDEAVGGFPAGRRDAAAEKLADRGRAVRVRDGSASGDLRLAARA